MAALENTAVTLDDGKRAITPRGNMILAKGDRMIISFAWTVDAVLDGRKTCTRRQWKERYSQQWVKAWRDGRLIHDAWDKLPRAGGQKVARIELTCEPYHQALRDMPPDDLVAEGGYWSSLEEFTELLGGDPDKVVTVVRFQVVTVFVPRGNLVELWEGMSDDHKS